MTKQHWRDDNILRAGYREFEPGVPPLSSDTELKVAQRQAEPLLGIVTCYAFGW